MHARATLATLAIAGIGLMAVAWMVHAGLLSMGGALALSVFGTLLVALTQYGYARLWPADEDTDQV